MLFDNLITWTSDGISITMTIFNEATGETTTITIPIGDRFSYWLVVRTGHIIVMCLLKINLDGDYKDVVTIIEKRTLFWGRCY